MSAAKTTLKARVARQLVRPGTLEKLAVSNDVFHYGVLAFMATGFHLVGHLWHALFIVLVVRCQLAFRGCPLTQLSDFLRSLSENGNETKVFRQGMTAWLFTKYGYKALPLIIVAWLIVIALQNLTLYLLKMWI